MTTIERRSGKKGVWIESNKYGIELTTMRNGFQATGMGVDEELLEMIASAIEEYFKRNE